MDNTRKTLIQKICNQYDENSWESFVEIYQPYLYVIIRRMNIPHDEIADLLQNILLKLWKKLPEFTYEPNKAKFRTWLFGITKNHVLNYLRDKQYKSKKKDIFCIDQDRANESEIDLLMTKEWENYIANKAMERVRASFNGNAIDVFERSLKGDSISEIALGMELEESSVYKLRSRVRDRLKVEIRQLRQDIE